MRHINQTNIDSTARNWGQWLATIHACNTSFFTAFAFISLPLTIFTTWYVAPLIFVIFFLAGFYANYDIFSQNVPAVLENLLSKNGLFDTDQCDTFEIVNKDVSLALETKQAMVYHTRYIVMHNSQTAHLLMYDRDNPTKVIILNNNYAPSKQDTEQLKLLIKSKVISHERQFYVGVAASIVGISIGVMGSLPVCYSLLTIILAVCSNLAIPVVMAIMFAAPIVMFLGIVSFVCLSALFIKTVVNYLKDDKNLLELTDNCNDLFNLTNPNCKLIARNLADIDITTYTNNLSALSFTGNKAYVLFYKNLGNSDSEYKLYFVDKNQQTFTECQFTRDQLTDILSHENNAKLTSIIQDNTNEQISLTFQEFDACNKKYNNSTQNGELRTKCQRILNILLCFIGSAVSLIGVFMTMSVFVNAAKNLLINVIPKCGLMIIDFVGFVLAAIPRVFFAITSFLKTYTDLLFKQKSTSSTPEKESYNLLLNFAIFFNSIGNGMLSLQGGLNSENLHGLIALLLHQDIGAKIVTQLSAILSGISGALNSACTVLSRGSRSSSAPELHNKEITTSDQLVQAAAPRSMTELQIVKHQPQSALFTV